MARHTEQSQRSQNRPAPGHGHQVTHRLGSEVENIPDIKRKHGRKEWKNENRAQGNEHDHAQDGAIVAHVNEAFLEPSLALLFFLRRPDRTRRQRSQGDNQRKKCRGVAKERGGGAPPGDEQAGNRRTNKARAMEDRTVERDGRRDLLLADKLGDEGADRRHLKRDANAEAERQNDDVPNLDVSAEDEESEDQREGDLGHLRPDEDLSFIVTIGGLAAFHREQNGWHTGRRRGQPKVQPAIGERAHHPALGHHLHPDVPYPKSPSR